MDTTATKINKSAEIDSFWKQKVDVSCTYGGLQILPHDADVLLDCLNFTEVDVSCTYDGLRIPPHDADMLLDCFNSTEPEYSLRTTNKRRKLQHG